MPASPGGAQFAGGSRVEGGAGWRLEPGGTGGGWSHSQVGCRVKVQLSPPATRDGATTKAGHV